MNYSHAEEEKVVAGGVLAFGANTLKIRMILETYNFYIALPGVTSAAPVQPPAFPVAGTHAEPLGVYAF